MAIKNVEITNRVLKREGSSGSVSNVPSSLSYDLRELANKVDNSFFGKLFSAIDSDGNVIPVNGSATPVRIRANFDFFSVGESSAFGIDSSGGGGGGGGVTVYDGLDSTNPNIALSANQGRVLKGLIDNMDLSAYALKSELATVATSGSYNDLTNKPTIPAAQIQSDWNQTTTTAKDYIKNKPTNLVTTTSLATALSDYLPLTGGTLSGNLSVTRSSTSKVSAANDNASASLYIASNNQRGLYDDTKSHWLVGTNGTNTFMMGGNVGINTSAPSYQLHVNGYSYATRYYANSENFMSGSTDQLYFSLNGVNPIVMGETYVRRGTTDDAAAITLGTSTYRWANTYSVLGNFSGQITSSVANGTAPLVVASSTLVTNLNADKLDGYEASGLFTNLSNSGNSISLTIGGTTNTLQVAYATSANSASVLANARTIWGQSFDGSANVKGDLYMLEEGASINQTSPRLKFNTHVVDDDTRNYPSPYIQAVHQASYNRKRLSIFQSNETGYTGEGFFEAFTVLPNGNVGINKSAPTYKLHVDGTGNFSGLLTASGNIKTASYIEIGDYRIVADTANTALKVVNKDGTTAVNFYATGENSALGVNTSGGGGGDGASLEAVWQTLKDNYGTYKDSQINIGHLTNALSSYVTSSALNTTLANYVTSSSLTSTLASYATTSAMNTALNDYLPLAGGTMTGRLITRDVGSGWGNGFSPNYSAITFPAIDDNLYHPYLHGTSSDGSVWNLGGYGTRVGIYGYFAGHTENNTDWRTWWNTTNGYLTHSGGMEVGGQITSSVANGTAPLVIASSTLVSNLNADKLDGVDASGLFTALSNSGNNISVTIGGTNKTLQVDYAASAGSATSAGTATTLANSRTIWGQNFNGSANVSGNMTGVGSLDASGDITVTKSGTTSAIMRVVNENGAVSLLASVNRGVYDSETSKWVIGTNGTNTFLMDGNVGIGTSSPTYKLHVDGDAYATRYYANGGNSMSGSNDQLYFTVGSVNPIVMTSSAVRRGTSADAANITLGTSSYRWANLYSVLGNFSGQITSSVATGTSPLSIASTTLVENLNADLLDGYHATDIPRIGWASVSNATGSSDQCKWFELNVPTSSGTLYVYEIISRRSAYPLVAYYRLAIYRYNANVVNVSLINEGFNYRSSNNTRVCVAIDSNQKVYIQSGSRTASNYLNIRPILNAGGVNTTAVGEAAFGTANGFTALKMITDSGYFRVDTSASTQSTTYDGDPMMITSLRIGDAYIWWDGSSLRITGANASGKPVASVAVNVNVSGEVSALKTS